MAHNEPKPIFVLCQSVYRVGSKLDTRTTGNANPTRTHHQEYTALKRLSGPSKKFLDFRVAPVSVKDRTSWSKCLRIYLTDHSGILYRAGGNHESQNA